LTVVKPEYAEAKSVDVVKGDEKKSHGPAELSVVKPEYAKSEPKGATKEVVTKSDEPAKLSIVKPAYAKVASEDSSKKVSGKTEQASSKVSAVTSADNVKEAKSDVKDSVAKKTTSAEFSAIVPAYAKAAPEEASVEPTSKAVRTPEKLAVVKPMYVKNEVATDAVGKPVEVANPSTVNQEESLLSRIHLTLEGDGALLEDAGLLKQLKIDLANIVSDPKRLSEDKQSAVKARIEECNKKLIEAGYYLASLWLTDANIDKSEVSVFVDAGRIRETKFYDAAKSTDAGAAKKDFSQKYFSEKQLRGKMTHIQKGQVFNYNDFRSDIFSINSHPDVMLDADLRVNKEIVDGKLRRYVDTDYMVKETVPLHAVLSLDNSGTDATGNWGAGLTVQHLNLTKHDDVLSVNVPVSIDGSLKSASGSYFLPYSWGNGGAYTLYGGYSEMYTEDVIPNFDEEGKGHFTGVQMSHKLMPNSKKHSLDVAAGITYRDLTSTTYFMGTELPERAITMVPLALTLSYSSLQPGFLGGRNFFTAQTIYHQPGVLGSSDDEEFEKQRALADSEYWIEKLQGARIQPLFGKKDSDGSMRDQWVLFLKGDAQIASGTLVPAEQMGVGGATTVRGYKERVNLGDNAFVGTAELRTPLLLGMISSPFLSAEQKAKRELDPVDYLQFITFFDYGYVEYADPQPGEEPSDSIYSVGVGVRMSLTKHSQLSLDYGIPLTTTEDDDDKNGRFHLNVKFQF
jgi:hemolysin activation/secretion protein